MGGAERCNMKPSTKNNSTKAESTKTMINFMFKLSYINKTWKIQG